MQKRRSKHFWVLFLISKMRFRPALRSLDHVASRAAPPPGCGLAVNAKAPGGQGTAGDIRGHQGMAGDIRGWQGTAGDGRQLLCAGNQRHLQSHDTCSWVLLGTGGGQTCGSLFGSQLRMLDAPLGASELLPDPASLWAEFWLVWCFPSRPRRAPSTAFPARGQMVALHSHGLVLSALY